MATKKITVELTDDQAAALAQMTKRFGWHHANELSSKFTTYGEGAELDVMLEAVMRLDRALARAGHAPR